MNTFFARKRILASALALALLLPLLCAAALADDTTPLLLTGVTWDMTPEAVMEAEGAGGADTTQGWSETGAQYAFNYPAEGGEPAREVVYVFIGGQLTMYSCLIDAASQDGETDVSPYYDILLARLTEAYGEPSQEQTAMLVMLTAMVASDVESGAIKAYALWDLGDGTVLYLENRENTSISYTFLNTARLFGIAV